MAEGLPTNHETEWKLLRTKVVALLLIVFSLLALVSGYELRQYVPLNTEPVRAYPTSMCESKYYPVLSEGMVGRNITVCGNIWYYCQGNTCSPTPILRYANVQLPLYGHLCYDGLPPDEMGWKVTGILQSNIHEGSFLPYSEFPYLFIVENATRLSMPSWGC
jgi:hypothetical protein